MSAIPGWLLRHTITVEPYVGQSAAGPKYGPAVTVRCFLDDQTREVRNANGEQVVSSSSAYALLGTVAPPESRVTLPDSRKTRVIAVNSRSGGGLPTPDHVEIQLV